MKKVSIISLLPHMPNKVFYRSQSKRVRFSWVIKVGGFIDAIQKQGKKIC
ncbi:MAG: hypothetical protein H6925_03190 [Holosporaceae bacterium]|nr:MAG: hypothetical protein H6925_03190 [Holosporaceae bacterium]